MESPPSSLVPNMVLLLDSIYEDLFLAQWLQKYPKNEKSLHWGQTRIVAYNDLQIKIIPIDTDTDTDTDAHTDTRLQSHTIQCLVNERISVKEKQNFKISMFSLSIRTKTQIPKSIFNLLGDPKTAMRQGKGLLAELWYCHCPAIAPHELDHSQPVLSFLLLILFSILFWT